MQANYLQRLDDQRNKFEVSLLQSCLQFTKENPDVDLQEFLDYFVPSKNDILKSFDEMNQSRENLCEKTGLFLAQQPPMRLKGGLNESMQQDLASKNLNDDIKNMSASIKRLMKTPVHQRVNYRRQPKYQYECDSEPEKELLSRDAFIRHDINPGEISKIVFRKSRSLGKGHNVSFGIEGEGDAVETLWIYRHQH